jgi:hypothetical protein
MRGLPTQAKEIVHMKPSDIANALASLLPARRPLYLWGPPGVGKSSLIHQAAQANGLDVIDLRAVLLDPVDLRGLPTTEDGQAVWLPPAFLPREGQGVLFLDELAQAPPLVQAGCLQLTLDRRIGEYVLPDGWVVVAASNRQEDRAGAHRLISPLLNRFVHLDLEVDNDDWHSWAVEARILPEVRAFLRFRPSLLFDFDPAANQRAFASPRSWEFVHDVLPRTPEPLMHPVLSGCVGEGPAAELVAFLRVYRNLPDVDLVLKAPASTSVPSEPAVLYALSGAMVERIRGADSATLENFMVYAGRMPKEYGVLTVRDGARANQGVLRTKSASSWLRAHQDLLLAG